MLKPLSCVSALLLVAGLAAAAPAEAQVRRGQPGYGAYDSGRVAYDQGYREGLQYGSRDARENRNFDYDRHRAYKDADRGYDRRYGARGQYRQAFRQGFAEGYRDGYGRYGRGRAVPRNDPYYGRYPDSRRYPDYGRSPSYPGSGRYGYASPAYDKGFEDGYKKGREDGEDRDRFDPGRHKWYREGDRGYNSRYGSREQWKREYRDAFRRGYEQGYQDVRSGYGYGDRSRGGWWPFE